MKLMIIIVSNGFKRLITRKGLVKRDERSGRALGGRVQDKAGFSDEKKPVVFVAFTTLLT